MIRPPLEAAEEASQLLSGLGIGEIPTPVERVARECGARIAYEPFDGDVSGLLFRNSSGAVIGVNSSEAKTRQRFTIAHELGHLCLQHDHGVHLDHSSKVQFRNPVSGQAVDPHEIAANAFAAELLMPRNAFETEPVLQILRDSRDLEVAVSKLAGMFQVSRQAMQIRLVNLGFLGSV